MRVFISHSSVDTWVASQIAEHINRCGAETFLDESDIEHGDDFDEKIVNAAEDCMELLVLLTPWAIERPYIWLEIGLFRRDKKRIVGVLYGLDETEVSTDPRIPSLMKKIHLTRIDDLDEYFVQLRRRVEGVEDIDA